MRAGARWGREVALGTAFVVVMAVVGVVAAWPIYAEGAFVLLAVLAVLAALALAVAARRWRWSPGVLAATAAVAFVVLGLALAVPTPWSSPAAVAGALGQLLLGAVTGWKDLLTVDLPVGDYRNLLVPALVVFLACPLTAALLAWRRDRWGSLAAVPALAMPMFALLFGRTVVSAPLVIGAVAVPAPVELAVGAASLIATLGWLAWRAYDERRAALRRAADTSGVRVSRRRSASDVRRVVLAAAMVAVAVLVGTAVAPAVAETRTRDVLRAATGPDLAIDRAVSPLSEYRANFADTAFTGALFRYTALSGAVPDRIRLATLTSYDGATYRVADDADGAGRFTRVPSRLATADGQESSMRIEIAGLGGIWMPTFGSLAQVAFDGPDADALTDSFYYDAATRSAVETSRGGLAEGDSYTLTATVAAPPALASLASPGIEPSVEVPDAVSTWVKTQDAGTGGAALETLIGRLRERGYLSHSLQAPAAGTAWTSALGPGYTFQPSASGHSLARVEKLFADLLQRESAAAAEGPNAPLVAAIGDDEQFAVAGALIAQELGFPARVVVGVRLTGADDGGVPACQGGVCVGGNVTAWLEVAGQDGAWVPVDVTPQHEVGVDTRVTRERDPENPTEVRPDAAAEVVPPDPTQQDSGDLDAPAADGLDLTPLWAVLRGIGMVVLAFAIPVAPLLVIVAAKALRRRTRRGADSTVDRIVGGWDEYVDAAVDHGMPTPGLDTRSELAERYDTPRAGVLAVAADRAVFSGAEVAAADSEEFWRIVDDERRRFGDGQPLWRRILAAVSLSSFTRGLGPRFAPGRPTAPRRTGRRGHRSDGGAR